MKTHNRPGVTLIELVAVIVVLGIGAAALLNLLSEVGRRSWFAQDIAEVSLCAQNAMERVRGGNFSTITDLNGTCPKNIDWYVNVSYCNLSGSNWIASGSNPLYKLINVTAEKTSSSTKVTYQTIFSNNTFF